MKFQSVLIISKVGWLFVTYLPKLFPVLSVCLSIDLIYTLSNTVTSHLDRQTLIKLPISVSRIFLLKIFLVHCIWAGGNQQPKAVGFILGLSTVWDLGFGWQSRMLFPQLSQPYFSCIFHSQVT